jgi:hypothetical protein
MTQPPNWARTGDLPLPPGSMSKLAYYTPISPNTHHSTAQPQLFLSCPEANTISPDSRRLRRGLYPHNLSPPLPPDLQRPRRRHRHVPRRTPRIPLRTGPPHLLRSMLLRHGPPHPLSILRTRRLPPAREGHQGRASHDPRDSGQPRPRGRPGRDPKDAA